VADISIKMKDGTIKSFPDKGRPGGSYSNKVRYEGAFVIVTDCYYKEYAYPASDVVEVISATSRGSW
jgi:hypothetical protein